MVIRTMILILVCLTCCSGCAEWTSQMKARGYFLDEEPDSPAKRQALEYRRSQEQMYTEAIITGTVAGLGSAATSKMLQKNDSTIYIQQQPAVNTDPFSPKKSFNCRQTIIGQNGQYTCE